MLPTSTMEEPTVILPVVDRVGPEQVSIQGIVYDWQGFDHPGGAEALRLWGGHDATITYFMVHHFHPTSCKDSFRFLQRKFKVVGRLPEIEDRKKPLPHREGRLPKNE